MALEAAADLTIMARVGQEAAARRPVRAQRLRLHAAEGTAGHSSHNQGRWACSRRVWLAGFRCRRKRSCYVRRDSENLTSRWI